MEMSYLHTNDEEKRCVRSGRACRCGVGTHASETRLDSPFRLIEYVKCARAGGDTQTKLPLVNNDE